MSFDELQSKWQSHDHSLPLNVTLELLQQEVRRNQTQFESQLFRRDMVEVIIAFALTCFFFPVGIYRSDWTLCFLGIICLGVGAFFLIDRQIQRSKRPKCEEGLESTIRNSLWQINHQIWLLKNILWWYLLPLVIGWAAFVGKSMWNKPLEDVQWHFVMRVYVVLCFAFFYFVYWLNQRAVKKCLEPRIKELKALEDLLASLKE